MKPFANILNRLRRDPSENPTAPVSEGCPATSPPGADPTQSPGDSTYDYAVALLRKQGCPVCNEVSDFERNYFFWYFRDSFYEVQVLERAARSFGFCAAHGGYLAGLPADHGPLAFVYRFLVGRLLAELPQAQDSTHFVVVDECPACASREEQAKRAFGPFVKLLAIGRPASLYGVSSHLCLPHLAAMAPRLPASTLTSVLAAHRQACARLRKEMAGSDGSLSITRVLRFAVGHDPRPKVPIIRGLLGDATNDDSDAVVRLTANLGRTEECAVCRELRRAREEWFVWLGGAVDRRAVTDLLPYCPVHVWDAATAGSPALALIAAAASLEKAEKNLARSEQLLLAPDLTPQNRPSRRLAQLFDTPRRRRTRTCAALAYRCPCPVCERMEVAETRTLELAAALLENGRYRALDESGYGLCVRHFLRALELSPPDHVRMHLIATARANMMLLGWEIDECQRKVAWQWRPEARGNERTASRRAMLRFSGTAAFPATG